MKISHRFWLWAGIATVVFYLACGIAWLGLSAARDSLFEIHNNSLVQLARLNEFRTLLDANRAHLLLSLQHSPSIPYASQHNHPVDWHFDIIAANAKKLDELFTRVHEDIEKRKAEKELLLFNDFREKREQWISRARSIIARIKQNDYSLETNYEILDANRKEFASVIQALEKLAAYYNETAEAEYQKAEERYQSGRTTIIILLLIGAIAGTGTGLLTMRHIRAKVAEAQQMARDIAKGDLTQRPHSLSLIHISEPTRP
ncbi:MAG: MCP four helix bundle domain-containing protein, partial [Rectinema sp.]|nr:MCP four helix bundle domain-containing protein [Rectinema sp.]